MVPAPLQDAEGLRDVLLSRLERLDQILPDSRLCREACDELDAQQLTEHTQAFCDQLRSPIADLIIEARSGSGGRSFRPAGRRLRLADLTASPWAWLPPASSMFGQRLRGETRELLFQPDQQLSQQPREFGLFLFGQCGEHASLGLEVAGSDACDEGSPFAGEGDEQSAAVVGVGDALDQALLLEPVEEVGHPARGAHQGAVELGRGATVGRSDAAESSQDVPARAAQPKAAEVAVQAAIEQRTRTADPCHDRDRRGVESWLFRPPLGQD